MLKGPWVVQRAVGTKPLIVGGALKVAYHLTQNYLEADIDIGSSMVANNVVRFVLGCDFAFPVLRTIIILKQQTKSLIMTCPNSQICAYSGR
mmetsp:Transcript_5814/g.14757  ORF Transcript_5814/g.14757 Transcript_5814/m.14757 type:complete len:92 (-) Transcript_5814:2031-2306(-)